MASFDTISAAKNAYRESWAARDYLFRLMLVPLALKLFCFTMGASFASGEDGNYLRFMLIMVPALIAEGWMLSHYVRYLVLGQTWPFRATGDLDADLAVLTVRARGILSGMIVFVLINMALGLLTAVISQLMMPYMPAEGVETPEVPAGIALLSVFLLIGIFWGFRLLWVYIPFALNIDFMTYMKKLRGFHTSILLIATWILCFLPFFLALQVIAGVIGGLLSSLFGSGVSSFIVIIITVIVDTLKSLVATAGITMGLKEMFAGQKNK